MTRQEIEAAASKARAEVPLLGLVVGLLLDLREGIEELTEAVNTEREARDSAWTRAKPEPRGKGAKRG